MSEHVVLEEWATRWANEAGDTEEVALAIAREAGEHAHYCYRCGCCVIDAAAGLPHCAEGYDVGGYLGRLKATWACEECADEL